MCPTINPSLHNLVLTASIVAVEKPTLIDLFSGCGGLGLGFHQAGFETTIANELHPDPAETYTQNLLKSHPKRMLIGSINTELSDMKLEALGLTGRNITCVAGGPPCQGFSMAGAGLADDPRNELYREFLRVVEKIQPRSVVFENVPGFATRYGIGLRGHLEETLRSFGYSIASGVLRAMDYGVPQLRRRFICIGIKTELLGGKELTLPPPTWTEEEIETELTAAKVLDDLDVYHRRGGYGTGMKIGPEKYLRKAKSMFQIKMRGKSGEGLQGHTWNTLIPRHTKPVRERMRKYLDGSSRSDLENTHLATKKHSQRVLHPDKTPNITIVSLPDDYIHYNKKLPRTLSVRECARLQTFPDDFRFYGKRTTGGLRRRSDVPQYTQVGNAIPPRLGEAIANHILRNMKP